MDWIGVTVPLLATLCYIALTGLVVFRGTRTPASKAFSVFLVANITWTLGSLAWHLTGSKFWNQILVSGIALGLFGLVYFVRAFLDFQSRRPVYVISLIVAVLLLMIWSGWVVTDSYMQDGVARMRLGPGFPVLMGTGSLCYVWAAAQLISYYRRYRDPTFRGKIQYLIAGLAIVLVGAPTNAIPGVGNYPIDVALATFTAALIAYAIFRHRLIDISIVIRKGLAYSLLTASVAAVYLLGVFLLQSSFQFVFHGGPFASALIVAVVFAILYEPVRRRTQQSLDRLFFREQYDSQRMIAEVSRTTASILDLQTLGNLVLERTATVMGISRSTLFVAEAEKDVFRVLVQRGGDSHPIEFTADHPVIVRLKESDEVLRLEELHTIPRFIALWAAEKRDLERMGAQVFVPIKLKGELVGILTVGPKLSEAEYSAEDVSALGTLANQIAVAVANARLVADLQRSLSELRETQNQLIQAGKLSAVGQLVAGVAHELNNPLTTVKGYAQLLCGQPLPAEVKRDLRRIDEAAERCRRIVQNLLTFARRHGSEMSMCSINEILDSTMSLHEYRFKVDNIAVKIDLQRDLPRTLADPYQLQQVFVNVISNAQYAMRATSGGTLTVKTRCLDGMIRVSISDTGPGMSPDIQARVFEPFFTTKEVGEGTGLGLSICYGIVEEHGGSIQLESEPGKGATFVIEVPWRQKDLIYPSSEVVAEPKCETEGCRILIVDDEEPILTLVKRALSEEGFIVDTASTGVEALEYLDAEKGRHYELVVSDVKMPGLDGPRLYAHLRFNRPGLEKRVVFMTGDTSSPDTRTFLESAKVSYIAKPFDLAALRQLVKDHLPAHAL